MTHRVLKIVSWNLRGLGPSQLPDFLDDLAKDVCWDILLLQECGLIASRDNVNDHRIFSSPKAAGIRPFGIVVHARLVPFLPSNPFFHVQFRSGAIDVAIKNLRIRFITAHLSA